MEYYIVFVLVLFTYPTDWPVNLKMIYCREILPTKSYEKKYLANYGLLLRFFSLWGITWLVIIKHV